MSQMTIKCDLKSVYSISASVLTKEIPTIHIDFWSMNKLLKATVVKDKIQPYLYIETTVEIFTHK
jgi:hypothetical protein